MPISKTKRKPGPKTRKRPRPAPPDTSDSEGPRSRKRKNLVLPLLAPSPPELDFSPGSSSCLFCLEPNVLPSRNILNSQDIHALCHTLGLGLSDNESKLLFAGSSYCSKCISVIRHIHTLLQLLEIEKNYIQHQILTNYGQLTGSVPETETSKGRGRRKTSPRDNNFEYYGEEAETLNRIKHEPSNGHLFGIGTAHDTFTQREMLRNLALFSEPVLIYDDEQILRIEHLDEETEDERGKSYNSKSKRRKRPTSSPPPKRECPSCGKSLSSKQKFKEHMKRHLEEQKYNCTECNQELVGAQNLKTHMEEDHQVEPPPEIKLTIDSAEEANQKKSIARTCPESGCNQTFLTKKEYDKHSSVHKPNFRKRSKTGDGKFSCGECGSKFTRSTHLRRHMQIHKGKSDIRCELCDRGFTEAYGLKRHMSSVHSENIIISIVPQAVEEEEEEENLEEVLEEAKIHDELQDCPEINEITSEIQEQDLT